jgi:flagellar biosynthesis/type III secretory pathway ATPase
MEGRLDDGLVAFHFAVEHAQRVGDGAAAAVLAHALRHAGQFPAIDVLQSVSRVMPEVTSREQQEAARKFRSLLAAYKDAEDLINIGAYQAGSNPTVDEAIRKVPAMKQFLAQRVDERSDLSSAKDGLLALCGEG